MVQMKSGSFTFRAVREEPRMGTLTNGFLQTGAVFIALLASPVRAADMPAKTSLPPPAAPAFSWTGLYFGLNAGWLAADNFDKKGRQRLKLSDLMPKGNG